MLVYTLLSTLAWYSSGPITCTWHYSCHVSLAVTRHLLDLAHPGPRLRAADPARPELGHGAQQLAARGPGLLGLEEGGVARGGEVLAHLPQHSLTTVTSLAPLLELELVTAKPMSPVTWCW